MTLLSGPNLAGNELAYVKECLDTAWVSSVGAYVTRFEEMLAERCGTRYAVATSSGTTALHTCLHLLGVGRGDLVICPDLTFVATLNAVLYTGAEPVLVDCDPETWQLDVGLVERFLHEHCERRDGACVRRRDGRRVPVVMPVHVLGNVGEMDRLLTLAEAWSLVVLEDSTEALGSTYRGRPAGSLGRVGTMSFNGNKLITTGGGGMIVTDDEALAARAKHVTTQAKADPAEYVHDEMGFNYRLTNVAAALGVAQMEQLDGFLARKVEIDAFYRDELDGLADVRFQRVLPEVDPNRWLFTILTRDMRRALAALNEAKLQSRPFWVPMHRLPMFADAQLVGDEHAADRVYERALSIPCSTNITDEELRRVVEVLRRVLG